MLYCLSDIRKRRSETEVRHLLPLQAMFSCIFPIYSRKFFQRVSFGRCRKFCFPKFCIVILLFKRIVIIPSVFHAHVRTLRPRKQGKPLQHRGNYMSVPNSYLPGTGATVIMKAVPPGRGLPIALRWADPCDRPKCGRLGCVIFTQGDCVRAIPSFIK